VLYQLSYMGRCRFRPTYTLTKTDRIAPSDIEIKKHRPLILSPCRLEALSLLHKVRQASRKLNKESHPVNMILRSASASALAHARPPKRRTVNPLASSLIGPRITRTMPFSFPGSPRRRALESPIRPAPLPGVRAARRDLEPLLAHKVRRPGESILLSL
jgi:hypothetical protein